MQLIQIACIDISPKIPQDFSLNDFALTKKITLHSIPLNIKNIAVVYENIRRMSEYNFCFEKLREHISMVCPHIDFNLRVGTAE
jgi:hypothetical protein